jgi:hypothetical protein
MTRHFKLVDQHQLRAISGTNEADHFVAASPQCTGYGQHDCCADSTCDHSTIPEQLNICRPPQRSNNIGEMVARCPFDKTGRCTPDGLDNKGDGPIVSVGVTDREWNPLAGLVEPDDHKLTGAGMSCDPGSLHDQPHHTRREA